MFDNLSERLSGIVKRLRGEARLTEAAHAIEAAVDAVFAQGKVKPADIGGDDGTGAVTRAVIEALG